MAEWRNWQTHQTQNLAKFTLREGSTPSSATINSVIYSHFRRELLELSGFTVATVSPQPSFRNVM